MKIVRETLERLTQCMLLPGVELNFDDVVFYVRTNVHGTLGKKVKKLRL